MKKTYLLLFALLASPAFAITRYVDSNSPGGNDGTSWATAWDHPNQVNGVGAGDTVFISGGTTNKTYVFTGFWDVPNGNSGSQLTFSRSTDTGHNGIVIFNASNTSIPQTILTGLQYVTFDFAADHNALPTASSCRLQFTGSPSSGCNVLDSASETYNSNGFKIFGAIFNWRIVAYGSRSIEVGACLFNNESRKLTGGPGWIVGIASGDTRGYGFNKFHHNRINLFYLRVPDPQGDNGDDAMQNCGGSDGGIDIYNNEFISLVTTGFAGANHQDGIQGDGKYIRIWNNYFQDLANYMYFGEYFWHAYGGHRIYNNIFNYTDPVLTANPSVAIAIGYKYGDNHVTDMQIFNNVVRGGNRNIDVVTGGWPASTGTNVYIVNNLRLGGGHIVFNGVGATVSNNPTATIDWFVNVGAQASTPGASDFHLTSSATGAINTGITPGTITTTTNVDKDGVTRPQGSAWDAGAYEFVSATGPGIITLSSSTYSTPEGVNVTITANRINGSVGAVGVSYTTTSGTATEGTDFTDATGTFSWANGDAAAKTTIVTVAQDSSSEGNESFNFTISTPTGGASLGAITTAQVSIVDDEGPTIPLMGALTFEAEAGLIEAPFVVSGGAISQTVDTDETTGGRARYRVTIPTTGAYSMTMNVSAPSTGTDSIFVEWDAEPGSTDIWDIGTTTGFETKTVSWRGAGGPSTPQFNPNFWNLTSGIHTLYIRGREPNVQINSITVAGTAPTDTTAPTPNPPVWEQDPIAPPGTEGQSRLTMTAGVVSDPSGPVEYYFDETSGGPGGTDSGWQQTVNYTDEGLTPNTTYTYTVKARDSAANETSASAVGSGTTNPVSSGGAVINTTNLIIDP